MLEIQEPTWRRCHVWGWRVQPPALLLVLTAGLKHRATRGQREKKQLGRVHEILGEPAWDGMGPGYSAVLPQHEGVRKNMACFRENRWI